MAVTKQILSSEKIPLITEKAVIIEIQRVYFTHFKNNKMSIVMFSKHSRIKFNWIRYYFGSWSNATKQAEIDIIPGFRMKDADEIIAEIKQVYFKYYDNSIMTIGMFSKHSKIKSNHIQKYFKSWTNALTVAGLNYYQDLKTISPNEIIAEIKRVYVQHFENIYMPSKKFIQHSNISLKKVLNCFGTWTNALKQAGLNSSPHFATANANEVISEIQRVYFAHYDNTYMMFINFMQHSKVSYYQICRHFDSWDNALTQAGICNSEDKTATHKSEIIIELQRVYSSHFENKLMSLQKFQQHSKLPTKRVIKYFGSWTNGIKEAGINHIRKSKDNPDAIIQEIQRVYNLHFENKLMTFKGFKQHSNICAHYIYKHYDSWDNAVSKAEINVYDSRSIKKAEILAEIKKVYLKNFEKSYITSKRFRQHSSVAISTIARYFDTWENALTQAGINNSININLVRTEEIITEIRRVYFKHFENTLMTFKGLKQFSKLSFLSIIKYFGSWENAVTVAEVNTRFLPKVVTKEILTELNRVYSEHYQNTYMTFDKCNNYYTIPMSQIRKYFNTWTNALKQANAYYCPDLIAINTEAIIKEIKKVYLEHNLKSYMTFPKFKQYSTISYGKIRIYFGTWENALTQSNSLYIQNAQDLGDLKIYNINEIIIELKRVYTEHYKNRKMSLKNFRQHSNISGFKIYKYLKSWDNALKQANIHYVPKLETRDEKMQQILEDLQRIKILKQECFFNHATYSENKGRYRINEILNLFSYPSWQKLINEELGIYKKINTKIKNNRVYYGEKELFDEMKRVWKKLKKQPTFNEFTLNTNISPIHYLKKYKTWKGCVERFYSKNKVLLNLKSKNQFSLSKDWLLEELKRIKNIHQKQNLSFNQYKLLGGKYSSSSFYTYFGSWKNAIQSV